jgi:hypothetical protein
MEDNRFSKVESNGHQLLRGKRPAFVTQGGNVQGESYCKAKLLLFNDLTMCFLRGFFTSDEENDAHNCDMGQLLN